MKTRSLRKIFFESGKLSGVEEHFIYNKYFTFLEKKKIDLFEQFFYFSSNFFVSFSNFEKKDLFLLIKYLLSFASDYELLEKKRLIQDNSSKIEFYEADYIKHYINNNLKLLEIPYEKIVFVVKGNDNAFEIIKYLDKNFISCECMFFAVII